MGSKIVGKSRIHFAGTQPTVVPDALGGFLDRHPEVQDHNGVNMFRLFIAAAIVCGLAGVGAATANADVTYKNCTQAHQDGRYNIPQGDPDYWSGGDRDGDGIACES
jgi:hypothetical protein